MQELTRTCHFTRLAAALCLILAVLGCGGNSPGAGGGSATAPDSALVELVARESVSVFDLLRESHPVDYTRSAVGVFVRSIDSLANSKSCFWIYTVNGKPADVACDRYWVGAGDTVRWHFRPLGSTGGR